MITDVKVKEFLNSAVNLMARSTNVLETIMSEMWNDGVLNPKADTWDDCRMMLINGQFELTDDATEYDKERVQLYCDLCGLIVVEQ